MNKLPKEKRDQLILVGMGTLFLLILIVFGLIRPQYATISGINSRDQQPPATSLAIHAKTPSRRPTQSPAS